ncbi:hypothetical protein [Sporichthya polymorpha]|uniref:hypothetical protein n=1 Tax=Sporichthya polymorpha TaxID=35751 RepID=UPI0003724EF4|nr:hypothetical protein [Sporichthya polymorpha]
MPNPGSRAYDTQRARRRDEADNRGIPDQKANEVAKQELADAGISGGPDPAKDTDRARGPKGER